MAETIDDIAQWLVSGECRHQKLEDVFGTFAQKLIAAGLPISRLRCTVLAMHPEVFGRSVMWKAGQLLTAQVSETGTFQSTGYIGSPVQAIFQGVPLVRQRIEQGQVDYEQIREIAAEGATDYLAIALDFGPKRRSFISIATNQKGGFDDARLRSFERLVPALETRLELESTRFSLETLLQVYLGPNAAARVQAGDFKRGTGQRIHAAIWLCDLRGFTSLADRLPVAEVVPVLDAYFESMSRPLSDGGEILKFIGDSILAVFPTGDDEAAAVRRAVKAAQASIRAFEESAPAKEHGLKAGVAVNLGEVMYGNIGAHDRLDFTVIGAAVNETARMEAMCKALKTPLVLSEPVAKRLDPAELVPLGSHVLRGVSTDRPLFTLRAFAPDSAAR
jgi:adenylate cyclase